MGSWSWKILQGIFFLSQEPFLPAWFRNLSMLAKPRSFLHNVTCKSVAKPCNMSDTNRSNSAKGPQIGNSMGIKCRAARLLSCGCLAFDETPSSSREDRLAIANQAPTEMAFILRTHVSRIRDTCRYACGVRLSRRNSNLALWWKAGARYVTPRSVSSSPRSITAEHLGTWLSLSIASVAKIISEKWLL